MDKPNPKIEALFKKTQPVCFGRFIIDIPASAQVNWGPTTVEDTISTYTDQGAWLPKAIKEKVAEIEAERHLEEPSMLIGVFEGAQPPDKIVVGYSSFETSGLVQLHSYMRRGKHVFVQSAPVAVLEDLPGGQGEDKNSYKKYVEGMQDIGRRLRVREESEIPSESGLCIEAGFVGDGAKPDFEMVSIGFSFPEYPDVRFSVRTSKTDRPNETNSLAWSLDKGQAFAEASGKGSLYSRIKILRRGERQMAGWEGEEALARMPRVSDEIPSVHEFLFKSIGVAHDALRPQIDMELSTGVDLDTKSSNQPSLTDEEAVALWDKLTSSIRVRPVSTEATGPEAQPGEEAKPKPDPKPQANVPLGTRLNSHTRCPQSGTWVCDHPQALGGPSRYFAEGEILPPILAPVAQGFWQKLRGKPQNHLIETTWTLSRLPDGAV